MQRMSEIDNRDVLIFRFLSGESSIEENEVLKQALSADEDFYRHYVELREVWYAAGVKENAEGFDVEHAISKFKRQTTEINTRKNIRQFQIKQWMKVVSVAASLFILFFVGKYMFSIDEPEMKTYCYSTNKGERKVVFLPDSTKVWLSGETDLFFSSDYNLEEREVKLDGEAFFDVVKNKEKPFEVLSGNHSVTVLGTRFNVNARSVKSYIETVLEEGKVRVALLNNDEEYILMPGEKVVYNRLTQTIKTYENIDVSSYTSWTTGLLRFRNETLENLEERLERWYGVDIILEDEAVSALRFTGTIENESIEQLLSIMRMSNGINYTKKNESFLITLEKNNMPMK